MDQSECHRGLSQSIRYLRKILEDPSPRAKELEHRAEAMSLVARQQYTRIEGRSLISTPLEIIEQPKALPSGKLSSSSL